MYVQYPFSYYVCLICFKGNQKKYASQFNVKYAHDEVQQTNALMQKSCTCILTLQVTGTEWLCSRV